MADSKQKAEAEWINEIKKAKLLAGDNARWKELRHEDKIQIYRTLKTLYDACGYDTNKSMNDKYKELGWAKFETTFKKVLDEQPKRDYLAEIHSRRDENEEAERRLERSRSRDRGRKKKNRKKKRRRRPQTDEDRDTNRNKNQKVCSAFIHASQFGGG